MVNDFIWLLRNEEVFAAYIRQDFCHFPNDVDVEQGYAANAPAGQRSRSKLVLACILASGAILRIAKR